MSEAGYNVSGGAGAPPPNPSFIPDNPLCNTILKMFLDEESADVVFEVEGSSTNAAEEVRKFMIFWNIVSYK